MASSGTPLPKYRRQKEKGRADRAFVVLNGCKRFLGRYGTPESRRQYDQLVAEWLAGGRRQHVEPDKITIIELADRFFEHAEAHYRRPDGTPTSELEIFRQGLRQLKALYGPTAAVDFGPIALRAVRERMIAMDWSRRYVNGQVNRVRRVFKWAAGRELIPAAVYQSLQSVEGLQRGRTVARETDPIKPVDRQAIRRVRPHLSQPVRGLIALQLLTGTRAGELLDLRATDIDTSGPVWEYKPAGHKTAHHGHERVIYFGPKAKRILRLFMQPGRPLDRPLFSPREAAAEAKRRGAKGERRPDQKPTPLANGRRWRNQYSQGELEQPRRIGDRYEVPSYRRAIHRACDKAGVTRWSPHRLRHNAATFLRREPSVARSQLPLDRHEPPGRRDRPRVQAAASRADARGACQRSPGWPASRMTTCRRDASMVRRSVPPAQHIGPLA